MGPWERNYWWSWINGWGKFPMVTSGTSPVYSDILGDGRTVRAYTDTPLDNNKTITLFGEDTNGQELMTRGLGDWTPGVKLTLHAPYVETPMNVRRIDRVIKEETKGPVRLYAWNSSASVLEDIALYAPSETNPDYVKTRLSGTGCCSANSSVVALVKLKFIPVKVDSDLVLIPNLDALKLMMMAIRCEDASDYLGKKQNEAEAISELNAQLWDDHRDDQVPVSEGPFVGGIGAQNCY